MSSPLCRVLGTVLNWKVVGGISTKPLPMASWSADNPADNLAGACPPRHMREQAVGVQLSPINHTMTHQ